MQTHTPRLRELTLRYRVRRNDAGEPIPLGSAITNPAQVVEVFAATLGDQPSEVFAILCLTTKRRVIGLHEVSRGLLDATLVHPREVFRAAILANAASIIVAHNHPSGDPTPSPDDIALTGRLVSAGDIIGINVLDHVVIGDGGYVSFRSAGLLVGVCSTPA
jgi:DNA repair protein RadC